MQAGEPVPAADLVGSRALIAAAHLEESSAVPSDGRTAADSG
ncbi:hypothetical protein STAFG_1160 [Streptomyces afghaniensis 772]|uniref:Uncharacterized protein n=1 Tax=Streptomyces afghaniensis 772 TaxID=1283301 RepID=S4MXN5_9ACTN|nr:hypothetical protein STAFG_1160 [Streptomyces afghaniensis 772]